MKAPLFETSKWHKKLHCPIDGRNIGNRCCCYDGHSCSPRSLRTRTKHIPYFIAHGRTRFFTFCFNKSIFNSFIHSRTSNKNIISQFKGVHNVAYAFPKVRIVTTAVDPELSENCFILPGIGNFGDRYFGTEKEWNIHITKNSKKSSIFRFNFLF